MKSLPVLLTIFLFFSLKTQGQQIYFDDFDNGLNWIEFFPNCQYSDFGSVIAVTPDSLTPTSFMVLTNDQSDTITLDMTAHKKVVFSAHATVPVTISGLIIDTLSMGVVTSDHGHTATIGTTPTIIEFNYDSLFTVDGVDSTKISYLGFNIEDFPYSGTIYLDWVTVQADSASCPTTPTANAGLDQAICADAGPVTLNGTTTIATGASWSGGNGTFTPDNQTLNATYTPSATEIAAGSANIILTTTGNGNNCPTARDTMTITISSAPTANAGPDQPLCLTSTINLSGAITVASGATWTTSGSGTFGNPNNLSTTYTATAGDLANGFVDIVLTTTGNGICNPAVDSVRYIFTSTVAVNAGSDRTICTNTVDLNGQVIGATGGQWNTSGSGTFVPNNTTLNATYVLSAADTAAGGVTLILVSTGNGACAATQDTVVVNYFHGLSVNINSSNPSSCTASDGSVTAVITNGTPPFSYDWDINGVGNIPDTNTFNNVPAGFYAVTVTDQQGCFDGAFANLNYPSGLTVSIAADSMAGCNKNNATATATASGGVAPYNYLWSNGDGDSIAGGLAATSYVVTVTDQLGCTATEQVTVSDSCLLATHGTISGFVYDDLNNNGTHDPGEPGIQGKGIAFHPNQYTFTDQNGNFSINVPHGTYIISPSLSSKYVCSYAFLVGETQTEPIPIMPLAATINAGTPTVSGITIGIHTPPPATACETISGHVFNDTNGNGIKDGGEGGQPNLLVNITGSGLSRNIYTDFLGNYSLDVPNGTYTIRVYSTNNNQYYCGTNLDSYVQTFPVSPETITTTTPSSGNNFGVQKISGTYDVGIYSVRTYYGNNPGGYFNAWMDFKGSGTFPQPCTLRLEFDPYVEFQNASIPPSSVGNGYVEWVFSPGAVPSGYCMNMSFYLSENAPAGYDLVWTGSFSCGGIDACPANDSLTRVVTVSGSSPYIKTTATSTPNSFEVFYPSGEGSGNLIASDTVFSYVINFQNAGKDEVYNMRIIDTLPPELDPYSVSKAFSSHPYTFQIVDTNVLIWEFEHLEIPGSKINYRESYGFLQFNVRTKDGLPLGSVIENEAHISFNTSNNVTTNKITNTVIITGISKDMRHYSPLTAYPNPNNGSFVLENSLNNESYDVHIINAYGSTVKSLQGVHGSTNIDLSGQPEGLYFILVNDDGIVYQTKIIKN